MINAAESRTDERRSPTIIDCHGHYTTTPAEHLQWRQWQLEAEANGSKAPLRPDFSDDQIRDSIVNNQLRIQSERGVDATIFSPQAARMGHHEAGAAANAAWSRSCNDLIKRVCDLFPRRYVGVCQLPQSADGDPADCVPELRRCVEELGFVGCNLNPDPSGGRWSGPPMTDRFWYPLYEAMVELEVPAMIHVSGSQNPNFHATGAHYLNGDTSVFMQLLLGDLFTDFPTLRFVIPHGGGAVPYHWGRYRGLAQDLGKPPLTEHLLGNVFFDTCVYHQPGLELLTRVIPAGNILFGSEIFGAVRGVDPETGRSYDDTLASLRRIDGLSDDARRSIFGGNALRVYPRLAKQLERQEW